MECEIDGRAFLKQGAMTAPALSVSSQIVRARGGES